MLSGNSGDYIHTDERRSWVKGVAEGGEEDPTDVLYSRSNGRSSVEAPYDLGIPRLL